MSRVSLIGLGVMGTALARTLLASGHQVTVWNRSPEKARALAGEGALIASSSRQAIEASPTTIVCIRSHGDTRTLLEKDQDALRGRNLIELSTGDAEQAGALASWVTGRGARCLVGMIAVFPKDIGKPDTAIVTVGSKPLWEECADILRELGGNSTYIGPEIGHLAVLYSALFLPRQGFMFGMIYGALLCRKAGLPVQTYVDHIPLTLKVVDDYYRLFADTVPVSNYDDPPASIGTYQAAFEDTLASFRALGASDELPALLAGLVNRGFEAGLGDKQLTALVDLLDR